MNMESFDQLVTIKLHGHHVTETFYDAHSCYPVLVCFFFSPCLHVVPLTNLFPCSVQDHVKIPLLCVNTIHDPLICASLIPYDLPAKNPNIMIVTTSKGGHIAWCVPDSFL